MFVLTFRQYGNATKDEISTNVLTTEGYPEALNILVLIVIAVVPLTKFPLKYSHPFSPLV